MYTQFSVLGLDLKELTSYVLHQGSVAGHVPVHNLSTQKPEAEQSEVQSQPGQS
jgi:hypothetical protein